MHSTKRQFLGIAFGLTLIVVATTALAANPFIRPDVVVIKLKPQAATTARQSTAAMSTGVRSIDQLNVQFAAADFRRTVPAASGPRDVNGLARYYTIQLPPGTNLQQAIAAYGADPNVEIAEPDYICALEAVPNDPSYGLQWTHSSGLGKDIDTQEAWDLEVGDSTVLVGVIDSGIEHTHPDLKASVWVNPGEDLDGDGVPYDTDDQNGLDDDGNSYIDDLIGYDFLPITGGCAGGEDCNGPDNNPDDFNGHGTHVNGIVAAVTDNLTGVAGIAGGFRSQRRPGVKLLGLRAGYEATDGNGFVIMTACAQAADYAVARGVSVINASWESSGTLIRTAFLNAVANGVVVCKAAGNDTTDVPDIGDTTFGVLAVAALRNTGERAAFTNYGTWVDISAPGVDIYNTYASPSYASLGGTSMASPTVAGVAALLKSHHSWFTKTEIDTLLMNYAEDVDSDNPAYAGLLGSGRVNAYNSLAILTTANFSADVTFGKTPLAVSFTNTSPNAPSGPYTYDFGDGNNGPGPDAMHTYTEPGIFDVEFTGSGPSGPHTRKRPEMMVVVEDTIEYGDILLQVGQLGAIPVRLHNTHPMTDIRLPMRSSGLPGTFIHDSISLAPLTAGWTKTKSFDGLGNSIAFRLNIVSSGTPIPVGGGIIAYMWVTLQSGNNGEVETLDSATLGSQQHTLKLISSYANFKPDFVSGSITVFNPCSCPNLNDPDPNGVPDIVDVGLVINRAFRGAAPLTDPDCPQERCDVDGSGAADIIDVGLYINVAFRGASEVTEFDDDGCTPGKQ